MTEPAVETSALGKRYGRRFAVRDCTFSLPQGRIAALVGPNGAGKSTLLRMLAGITRPSTGEITIFGRSLLEGTEVVRRVGYLDQERPLYNNFRVAEMLHFGRALNPRWDDARAQRQLDGLAISLDTRVGKLSGGQKAQVALTMCLAKRPELLLLDEPVAALDPLARENVMHLLLSSVVDDETTVLLSSHAISDLESVCDYVIILTDASLVLADELDHVLSSHRLLVGLGGDVLPDAVTVIASQTTGRQVSAVVRGEVPIGVAGWEVHEPTLEEIVIAYLRQERPGAEGKLGRPLIDLRPGERASGRR